MADPLYEVLAPYFCRSTSPQPVPSSSDVVTAKYLSRLSTLPLASLTTTEPQSLAQSSHTTLLSIQSLSSRSNAAVISSSDHLSALKDIFPLLTEKASDLQEDIPQLDERTVAFSATFSRGTENMVLDRRKKALLMERNADRLSDILDLPTLLTSSISSSTSQGASSMTNYASALDLYSHIKRLHLLYHDSPLIVSIYKQTESAMQNLTASLISSLRSPNIKLAAAMRTIGWLRRVAPELNPASSAIEPQDGLLGYLFLTCRLSTLVNTLSALDPLRQLADQETVTRVREKVDKPNGLNAWHGGQQTERYLKRYIEIFREQSFAVVSMYQSIFPASSDTFSSEDFSLKLKSISLKSMGAKSKTQTMQDRQDSMQSALSTFTLYLVELLSETLQQYLPNILDKQSRENLLTQVFYCAGSLGRLGGDFSFALAGLGPKNSSSENTEGVEDIDWVQTMRKHRELAGRLEALASGVGAGKAIDRRTSSDSKI